MDVLVLIMGAILGRREGKYIVHREEGLSIKQQKESTGNDRLKSFGGTNLCVSKDNYAGLSVFCTRSNIVDVTEECEC